MAEELNEMMEDDPVAGAAEAVGAEVGEIGADGESEAAAPPTLEEQLAALQAEMEEYKDRWLRSQAEFSNARKRMEKQRVETYANATADVMRKLLPVMDDFARAMEVMPAELAENSWSEGIGLVNKKLENLLEGFNVKPIAAVGEPFDPNLHEAIMQEESDEVESGHVLRELQKGYLLGERVIRPSLVVVAA
jgi:molecular chaperone GrpE